MSGKEEPRVSEKGNRGMSKTKPGSSTMVSPEDKHKHVPNYMKPTISSSLGQYRRSFSSSSHHFMIPEDTLTSRRRSLDKPMASPCPRISRNLSLSREHSQLLIPSSPRKSRNPVFESSKSHLSKGHKRGSSLDIKLNDSEKKVLSLSITSSRVASPDGDAKQEMRIEDRGDNHLESLTPSFCHDPPPALEDKKRVMVVPTYHHDDEIFNEVQAMILLEDYNRDNEISPVTFEDNKEHIVVVDKGNHDDDNETSNEIHAPHDDSENSNEIHPTHDDSENSNEIHPPRDDSENSNEIHPSHDDSENSNEIHPPRDDSENSNEIHPPHDDSENSNEIHPPHDDSENSNEIHPPHDDDIKNTTEIHPMVVEEDKEHIAIVQFEKQDEYCQVQNSDEIPPSIVEGVDKEDFVIVQADNHDQVVVDNSIEVLQVMAEEEHEKDVIIVKEDVLDHQPPTQKKQEDIEEGDHSGTCSTNLDIIEEVKGSDVDEINTKHQEQEQDNLNVIEAQDDQEHAITSANVSKEISKEQVNDDSIIVTEETKKVKEEVIINKRMVTNKKETSMAYNDVIEETKRKLLQDRKNKVLALVGAFETVMSIDQGQKK
ncbi:protein starmaker-like [Impatiens glandulifera]|uniref:protein starmaker-like n=1 Tax=Impatiens glandulifera TaxID=253017 RepID=UPI001FB0A746|nr:protein starmaker-like [Impatiens glandulifera]